MTAGGAELHDFPFAAMGCACGLRLYARDSAQAEVAAEAAMAEVARIEHRYSRYRSDSVLSEINWQAGKDRVVRVDDETAGLLDYAQSCHRLSGGLFDITSGPMRRVWDFTLDRVPEAAEIAAILPCVGWDKVRWKAPYLEFLAPGMELDLGGLGKEYAADQAAEVCRRHGIEGGLIDLGGDLCVIGPHPGGEPWIIGIRHPRAGDRAIETTPVASGGVASSGDYGRFVEQGGRRFSHLLDARTGWPVEGLAGVTVLADRCLVAGTLSTIAMLKGLAGIDWLAGLGVPHLWVTAAGERGGSLAGSGREAGPSGSGGRQAVVSTVAPTAAV